MKIAFIWQGFTGRYGVWRDGLWGAMKILEKEYEVTYHEPTDDIPEDAVVLYWEAPCTINGDNAAHYKRVMNLPNKKILLFAGGPLKREWMMGFDHVCVESKINAEECEAQGIPHTTAFGINEEVFKPMPHIPKKYMGIHAGTCASWKRQWLVGEALGPEGLVVGRGQASDPHPFDECRRLGTTVMDEQVPQVLAELVNASHTCVQTSDYWGGGQRCTLEAMACNVWPIVMSDSPKNREYVEESGFGAVVSPSAPHIRNAVNSAMQTDYPLVGRDYILSKWTMKHYADNLKIAISKI